MPKATFQRNPVADARKPLSIKVKQFLSDLSEENFNPLKEVILSNDELDYNELFEEVNNMNTRLNASPVDAGLDAFHKLLAQVQAYKDRLVGIMIDVYSLDNEWGTYLFVVDKFYNHNKNALFTESYIQELKNQALRDAEVDRKLAGMVMVKDFCNLQLSRIKSFLRQCDLVYNNLKSANDNIDKQIRVIQQQISIREISEKLN